MLSATIRDIAIIIIAVQSIVIGVLIGVLIWQIWRLVKIIQNELKPIIEDTQNTVNTVRGTATFVSDNVVNPVVRTNRAVAKWSTAASVLGSGLGWGRRRRRRRRGTPPDTAPPESEPGSPPPNRPRPTDTGSSSSNSRSGGSSA